jgi:hypothetical protein
MNAQPVRATNKFGRRPRRGATEEQAQLKDRSGEMDSYSMEVAARERQRQEEEAAEQRWLLSSAGVESSPRRWSPRRATRALSDGRTALAAGVTRRASGRSLVVLALIAYGIWFVAGG